MAKAQRETLAAVDYDPLLAGVTVFLSGIAVGIITNALYDMVKQVVLKQTSVQKRLEKLHAGTGLQQVPERFGLGKLSTTNLN